MATDHSIWQDSVDPDAVAMANETHSSRGYREESMIWSLGPML